MAELFANSRNPEQTPRSAASDLGLHCLPIALLGVSRLQWIKTSPLILMQIKTTNMCLVRVGSYILSVKHHNKTQIFTDLTANETKGLLKGKLKSEQTKNTS